MRLLARILTMVAALALVRIALPKFRNNVATSSAGANMRSQLRRLRDVWDSLPEVQKALDSASLAAAGFRSVAPGVYAESSQTDAGVQLRIIEAGPRGFAADATHDLLAVDARCGIWVGSATPPVRGAAEGAPMCERFFEPLLGRERLRRR